MHAIEVWVMDSNIYLKNWFELFQATNCFWPPSNDAIFFDFQISTVSGLQCNVPLIYRYRGENFFGVWAIALN